MKLNMITRQLYTNDGTLLKKLHCPYGVTWQSLTDTDSLDAKACDICKRIVYDTASMTDESVLRQVRQDHDTCLKVDLNQSNLRIVSIYGGQNE